MPIAIGKGLIFEIAKSIAVTILLGGSASAANLQSDCRAPGTIGTATMSPDGTVTLNLHAPDGTGGVVAYPKSDPNYARIISHLGGIRPGEHKPVPAFCGN